MTGRQHLGALFNLVAYYVLALPLGITLAFGSSRWSGLCGLWVGQVVALFIVGAGEYFVVWLGTDWEGEVQRGAERNQRGPGNSGDGGAAVGEGNIVGTQGANGSG